MKRTGKRNRLAGAAAIALCIVLSLSLFACVDKVPDPYVEGDVGTVSTASGFTEAGGKFYSDFKTLEDAHEAGKDINIRLAEEGSVLLKNDGALPLNRDERYVTLLGVKSVDIQTGGGGSGAGRPGGYGIEIATLPKSMEAAGFKVNQKILDMYTQNIAAMQYTVNTAGGVQTLTKELPMSYYNNMIVNTYGSYNDAAIITFSRTGAEGYDLAMRDISEYSDKTAHILQLSDAEEALVKHAKANFKKVIVLLNSSNIMEVGELNEQKTADNLGVDAILWVGHTGNDGAYAIGEILSGAVNPSGHTVDIWSKDFKKDPSWTNFGDNRQNGQDNYLYRGDTDTGYRTVEYREDIYNGYRYYETLAADMNAAQAGTGDSWYAENVVYPFGYGLSYTSFDWQLDPSIHRAGVIAGPKTGITVKVQVTNTGDVTGKDVVQVYAGTPYKKGGIEKAATVLVGFAKTKLLKPGESQTVTVQLAAQEMASFDYSDKNGNDFAGYELEAGDYVISVCRDSHTVVDSIVRTVESDIKCPTDLQTGNEITAVFSQTEGALADYNSTNEALLNNLLSRSEGLKQPASSTKQDRQVSQGFVDMIEGRINYEVYQDSESDPWYVKQVPSTWKQAASHNADYSDVTTKISAMAGVDYEHYAVENGAAATPSDEGSKKWEAFMNQLTWDELCQIASQGSYGRPAVKSIDKPLETDIDGPAQIAWFGDVQISKYYPDEDHAQYPDGMGTNWVTAVVVASTWNKELAEEQGLQVGNESILTNSPGWYGPSLNMHRSPLGGRNFEYYSEDPVVSGVMAAAVTYGATSKGVVCYAKHMFLNDQETNRDTKRGLFTYATEQAIREIYLKPFEYVIKTGRSLGTMCASNRIGNFVAFGNYALHNAVLRDEWNFKGCNITDSTSGNSAFAYASMNHLIRNGVDMPLGVGSPIKNHPTYGGDDCPYYLDQGKWNADENMVYVNAEADDTAQSMPSPTQYYSVRMAAQHMLYVSANSNGIDNGITTIADVNITLNGTEKVNKPLLTAQSFGASAMTEVKVSSGELPAGLTLSDVGVLSGEPTKAGTYVFKISLQADGWIKKQVNVSITVNDVFDFDGSLNVAAGSAITGSFATEKFIVGETVLSGSMMGFPLSGKVVSVGYSSKNLPEGLTLNADGSFTGSVAAAGEYTVEVTMTAKAMASLYGMTIPISTSFTQTFVITVT